jgi:hypothetical protein
MAQDIIERVQYREFQYLGAADFQAEQDYMRDMRRRHNLAHHTYGIVIGLEPVQLPAGAGFAISPGMAIDKFGREIVMLSPFQLNASDFSLMNGPVDLFIAYQEAGTTLPPPGYQSCEPGSHFSRTEERYQIFAFAVAGIPPPPDDPININGSAPPPPELAPPLDGSAPYQEFPDTATSAVAFLKIGTIIVTAGVLSNPSPDHAQRLYTSAVAARLLVPGDGLVVEPRTPWLTLSGSVVYSDEFLDVDGAAKFRSDVTAQSEVFLQNGHLQFQGKHPTATIDSLYLARQTGADGNPNHLRIHIGNQKTQPPGLPTVLTIGPGDQNPNDEQVALSVDSELNVEIPQGSLSFGSTGRTMLKLLGEDYTIGVNPPALAFQADTGGRFTFSIKGSSGPGTSIDGGGITTPTANVKGALTVTGGPIFLDTADRAWLYAGASHADTAKALAFDALNSEIGVGPTWAFRFQGPTAAPGVLLHRTGPSELTLTGDLLVDGRFTGGGRAMLDVIPAWTNIWTTTIVLGGVYLTIVVPSRIAAPTGQWIMAVPNHTSFGFAGGSLHYRASRLLGPNLVEFDLLSVGTAPSSISYVAVFAP